MNKKTSLKFTKIKVTTTNELEKAPKKQKTKQTNRRIEGKKVKKKRKKERKINEK